jgi:hypothetical protein
MSEQLRRDDGCPIYLHNVGGKEPDGTPTRVGKWTFATKMVRDVVLDHVDGRVLNACAGQTRLQKRGCEFVRNDIDEEREADLHVDVREIHQHLEAETFDAAILDPPFDPGRAEKLYEGWHGQEYSTARDAVAEVVAPGGTVIELGWNSWSLSDKDGWEAVEHHLYRQSSFKADIHLTVDRKINQQRLVPDGGQVELPRQEFISHPNTGTLHYGTRADGADCGAYADSWAVVDADNPLDAVVNYATPPCTRCFDHAHQLVPVYKKLHSAVVIRRDLDDLAARLPYEVGGDD